MPIFASATSTTASGSGSTVGTAVTLKYALETQSLWSVENDLRLIRDSAGTPFTIVPSGATGTQMNQILADLPAGTAARPNIIQSCNTSGEIVPGCRAEVTCSGFGATAISMLVFKPSLDVLHLLNLVINGASSDTNTGSYNLINNSGETGTASGTNTTTANFRWLIKGVEGKFPRHNGVSLWTGPNSAPVRFGLEMEDVALHSGGYANSNGLLIARPGTNGNSMSVRARRCVFRDNQTGAGVFLNNLTNPADAYFEECVFSGNDGNGLEIQNTGGSVTLVRCVGHNNGTDGSGSGLYFGTIGGTLLVEDNILSSNGSYAVDDEVIEPGVTTGRTYRNNRLAGNVAGQFNAQVLDLGGGEGVIAMPGVGNENLSSIPLEAVLRGDFSGFGKRDRGVLSRLRREFVGGYSLPGVGLSDSARALRGMMR